MTKSPLAAAHLDAGATLHAVGSGEVPWSFGEVQAEVDATRAGCGLFDLSYEGVLRLVGEDTKRFANSQLTNNFRDMEPGGAARAGITDRKGRLQGLTQALLLADDTLLVVTDGVDTEWLHDRLDMYIIMDPIELDDLSEERVLLSLQGPKLAEVLEAAGASLPEPGRFLEWGGALLVSRDRTGLGGVDLIVPVESAAATWAALLGAGAKRAGFGALEALRVQAGQPRWPVDMGDRAFIHELGLVHELVSFSKGCYMGQEVINRMETMGKLTRSLQRLVLDGPADPGAPITLDGKSVGAIGSVVELDGARIGLALLRVKATESGQALQVGEGDRQVNASVRQ